MTGDAVAGLFNKYATTMSLLAICRRHSTVCAKKPALGHPKMVRFLSLGRFDSPAADFCGSTNSEIAISLINELECRQI